MSCHLNSLLFVRPIWKRQPNPNIWLSELRHNFENCIQVPTPVKAAQIDVENRILRKVGHATTLKVVNVSQETAPWTCLLKKDMSPMAPFPPPPHVAAFLLRSQNRRPQPPLQAYDMRRQTKIRKPQQMAGPSTPARQCDRSRDAQTRVAGLSSSGVQSQQHVVPTGQVDHVAALCQLPGDVLGGFNATQLNHAAAGGLGGLRDEACRLALTLCPDDRSFPLLQDNSALEYLRPGLE